MTSFPLGQTETVMRWDRPLLLPLPHLHLDKHPRRLRLSGSSTARGTAVLPAKLPTLTSLITSGAVCATLSVLWGAKNTFYVSTPLPSFATCLNHRGAVL